VVMESTRKPSVDGFVAGVMGSGFQSRESSETARRHWQWPAFCIVSRSLPECVGLGWVGLGEGKEEIYFSQEKSLSQGDGLDDT